MKVLVIYDDTGKMYSQVTGDYLIPQGGIQFLELEVPKGKYITGVDLSVTPHQAILEDIPSTEVELLEQKITEQEQAILELSMLVGGGA